MERSEAAGNAPPRRRRAAKNKDQVVYTPPPPPPVRTSAAPPVVRAPVRAPSNEAKLAALAVDLNVRLRSTEMPAAMQERAMRRTRALLDANPGEKTKPNPTHLAMALKKEFDGVYGPAWHCIVGKSFGSFVTHASGGFLYFSVDKLCFLLFKTPSPLSIVEPSLLPNPKTRE